MKLNIDDQVTAKLDDFIAQRHYRLVNSVFLWRDGEVLAERYYNKYTEESRNHIKSVWKSILAVCAGICMDKGYIKGMEQPLSDFLPEFDGSREPYHKMLKLRHIFTMTSGIYWNGGIHYHCPMLMQCARSGNMVDYISDIHMENIPGNVYVYKEWDAILASAVLGKATGMNAYDFCQKYLYGPLAIKSGRWFTAPDGISYTIPGNNFKGVDGEAEETESDLSVRDMAKIGMLFLNRGMYDGKQIVSEEFVQQAVTPLDCNAGYGMFWWLGSGWYGCRGFGGQEVTVVPDKNIVFAMQAKATPSGKHYDDVLPFLLECI